MRDGRKRPCPKGVSCSINCVFPTSKSVRSTKGKLKISRRRKGQLVVSYQVMTDPCCGLSVILCGFISHLIGHKTINIIEIFSGVHSFTGKAVNILFSNLAAPVAIMVFLSSIMSQYNLLDIKFIVDISISSCWHWVISLPLWSFHAFDEKHDHWVKPNWPPKVYLARFRTRFSVGLLVGPYKPYKMAVGPYKQPYRKSLVLNRATYDPKAHQLASTEVHDKNWLLEWLYSSQANSPSWQVNWEDWIHAGEVWKSGAYFDPRREPKH